MSVPPKEGKRSYNTALYARISVEDKSEETSSIENQILIAHNYLTAHEDLNFIDTYIDEGQSGTTFVRPAFLRLMSDLHMGKVQCVIVKDLSRFGRNYLEVGNYLENVFPSMGVRFISINDHFDSIGADENAGFFVSIKALLHDYYAKDISKKVSTAIDVKKKSGKFMNRIPPYGYARAKKNPYQLEIVEVQAEVVKNIFGWYMEGMGVVAIARKLNDLEVPTRLQLLCLEGKKDGGKATLWHASTVLNILQNPSYLGCLVERKTEKVLYKGGNLAVLPQEKWNLIPNTHQPIIPKETFEKVQELRKESAKKKIQKRGKRDEKPENIFRGLLRCGVCGSILQRDSGYLRKDGTRIYHYYCPQKYRKSGSCSGTSVSEESLRKVVFAVCKCHCGLRINKKDTLESGAFFEKNRKERAVNSKDCKLNLTKTKKNRQVRYEAFQKRLLLDRNMELLTHEFCCFFINKIVIKENQYVIQFAFSSEYAKMDE